MIDLGTARVGWRGRISQGDARCSHRKPGNSLSSFAFGLKRAFLNVHKFDTPPWSVAKEQERE
eukprot:4126556-Amphidinium_carterae.1